MRLYSKDIEIGHPAVPWIIAGFLEILVGVNENKEVKEWDMHIGELCLFNPLSYDVMGELMVKLPLMIYYEKALNGWVANDYTEFGMAGDHYGHGKTPQEAVAMCAIKMEEYYDDIPDELV